MSSLPLENDSRNPAIKRRSNEPHQLRGFWLVTAIVLGVQLVGLCIYSLYLYNHFDLTDDFATYSQAWWQISHGYPNPIDTIHAPVFHFWQNHFELAMWPISLLGVLWSNAVSLLWLQDLALVATELVVVLWIDAICATRFGEASRVRNLVPTVALLALVGNVWWYETASFDVHFETLGLPFVMLTAFSLWKGNTRSTWIYAAVGVLFGDVVSLSILGVGLAGLVSRQVRRSGNIRLALTLVGFATAWIILPTALNGNQGSGIVQNYGYLVHASPKAGALSVMVLLLLHPLEIARVIVERWHAIGRVVMAGGLLGVVTPWGLFMVVVTLGPAALNSNSAFISPIIAFQTLIVIPFVYLGTAMLLTHLGSPSNNNREVSSIENRIISPKRKSSIAWIMAGILIAISVFQSIPLYSSIRADWWRVNSTTATTLTKVLPLVPNNAEVVISQGVIGRFATHKFIYPFLTTPQAFPVHSDTVDFVIVPSQGIESVPSRQQQRDISFIQTQLHAKTLIYSHGVFLAAWHPPRHSKMVVLP